MIECPICKKQFKSLNKHIEWKHNMSISQFKEKYNITKMQEDCRKTDIELKCPCCEEKFNRANLLSIHIKFNHKEYWNTLQEQKKRKKEHKGNLICKICGFKTNLLYYHISSSHKDISWEDYCLKYNHDINVKSYFTEEHKKMLSVNKKKFYNSDKGLLERERLSKKYSGEKNPACRPEVRKKISDAAIKKMVQEKQTHFQLSSYGIKFKFLYNGNSYRTRSFEEFKVLYTLLKNNIQFEYEKIFLKYKLNNILHTYILDLKIKDMYIEIKSNTSKCNYYELPKYKSIESMLNSMGKHLQILTYEEICNKLNIKPIKNLYLYKDIKQMLDNDQCFISKYISNRKHINSRILQSIDCNYKNNKNIVLHGADKYDEI